MKKQKMNKKKLMTFGLIGLFSLVLVTGALLTYYGQINQNVNVEQAVVLTCPDDSTGVCTESTGSLSELAPITLLSDVYSVKNVDPENSRNVELITSCLVDDGAGYHNCATNEVTTSYVGVLELTKKDTSTWQPTGVPGDTIGITYTIVGSTFEYKVISGVIPSGYELVYAMDKQDRFDPANYATVFKQVDINGDLPISGDWNAGLDADYCGNAEGDNYEHCRGAKLWIIPTSAIGPLQGDGSYKLTWAGMVNYYWETDLIVYSTDDTITLPAEGGFDFMVENTFAGTGDYTITTEVRPA